MSRWGKRPICPECGGPLLVEAEKDEKTGEIVVGFSCTSDEGDTFIFEILTGLRDKDLKKLKEKGRLIRKEMNVRLLEREPASSS
jgi:hypothetical protein